MVSPQNCATISPMNTGRMLLNSSPTVAMEVYAASCFALAIQMIVAKPKISPENR